MISSWVTPMACSPGTLSNKYAGQYKQMLLVEFLSLPPWSTEAPGRHFNLVGRWTLSGVAYSEMTEAK